MTSLFGESTIHNRFHSNQQNADEKTEEKNDDARPSLSSLESGPTPESKPSHDDTHRKLKSRHIQLIGIGGTIGTALYVQIGRGLMRGGPMSLFLAFTIWCTVILAVNACLAEMVTYLPISSPFIRFAGRYVDDAFGVAAGWNFFLFEAALVPFEIVACNVIITYWTSKIHVGIIIAIILVIYGAVNLFAVKWYGETEFWMALGKVLLILGLMTFTFITMVGGNPQRDAYGFRYWKDPGLFAEHIKTGDLGRFLGFLACLIQASFTIAGPDYVGMAAGEAANPRVTMPRAFNAVFYRLTFFFVLGSLCVGIVVPYSDETLIDAFAKNKPGAAASPYVIAMDRMGISVLPDIVNALVLTAALSAGNSYVFCASRSLYGLALEGKAPKFLTKCNTQGVPVYCVFFVLGIGLISFLQVSNGAAVVLSWFVSLVTASQLINFTVMSYTFIHWRNALKAQNIPLESLPYVNPAGKWGAYYGFTATLIMAFVGGYTVFMPGMWDLPNFLFSYLMIGVFPVIYIAWKLIKKTKWRAPHEVDLLEGKAEIDAYEASYVDPPPRNVVIKYWDKLFG